MRGKSCFLGFLLVVLDFMPALGVCIPVLFTVFGWMRNSLVWIPIIVVSSFFLNRYNVTISMASVDKNTFNRLSGNFPASGKKIYQFLKLTLFYGVETIQRNFVFMLCHSLNYMLRCRTLYVLRTVLRILKYVSKLSGKKQGNLKINYMALSNRHLCENIRKI